MEVDLNGTAICPPGQEIPDAGNECSLSHSKHKTSTQENQEIKERRKCLKLLVPPAGLEPATQGLGRNIPFHSDSLYLIGFSKKV